MYSSNGSISLGATSQGGVESTFLGEKMPDLLLVSTQTFYPISSSVRKIEELFLQAVRQIYSKLLPVLLVVVSRIALLVSPLSVLIEFSLG
jgi:hypothetical protein